MEQNIPSLVWTLQGFCGTLKSSVSHRNISSIKHFSISFIICECSILLNTDQHHFIGFGSLRQNPITLQRSYWRKRVFVPCVSLASFCYSVTWKKCLPLSQISFLKVLGKCFSQSWVGESYLNLTSKSNYTINGKTEFVQMIFHNLKSILKSRNLAACCNLISSRSYKDFKKGASINVTL